MACITQEASTREILFPIRHPIILKSSASVAGAKASIMLLPIPGPVGWLDDRSLGSISFGVLVIALPLALAFLLTSEKMQIPLALARRLNDRLVFFAIC